MLEFKEYVNDSKDILSNHCQFIRDEIEISFESLIEQLKQQKDALIKNINSYEAKCSEEIDTKITDAQSFIKDNTNLETSLVILNKKRTEFKNSIFQHKFLTFQQNESEIDPCLLGYMKEENVYNAKPFNFANFFDQPYEPECLKLDCKHEMRGPIKPFGCNSIILCLTTKKGYELQKIDKTACIIKNFAIDTKSKLFLFSTNSTNIFILLNDDSQLVLKKYDENFILIKTKEISLPCTDMCCTDDKIYLLIEEDCSECLYNECDHYFLNSSIKCLDCETLKFTIDKFDISNEYKNGYETGVHLYSQNGNVFLFYEKNKSIIENIFTKDSIKAPYSICPYDAYVVDNLNSVFFKWNYTWFLTDKKGKIMKQLKIKSLKSSDYFCITIDGSFFLISKNCQIKVY